MADDLVFMMGQYEARIPGDRLYSTNHLWLMPDGDHFQVGFTAYSVRLLQDVYFLDWMIEPPLQLAVGQEIGSIESKKAESSLYAPLAGRLEQFNEALLEDPSAINTDKYGQGWLFEMGATSDELMSAEKYVEWLASVWGKTQQAIKGQLNE